MQKKNYITVAVADDHSLYRKALCQHLRRLGFQVLTEVSNGKKLIEELATVPILPDICIIDVHMPVMDGIATTAFLKQEWKSIRILSMSMDNDPGIIKSVSEAGADRFLEKGCAPEELKMILLDLCKT